MENSQKQSQVSPGNTNNRTNFARFFQITLNNEKNGDVLACNYILDNKYNNIIKYLKGRKQLKYFISCKELNKKGFYHYHIYCQFEKSTKLSIKKMQGAHIEICRGSVDENIDYIKKDGNIIEEYGNKILNYNKMSIKEVLETKNNIELLNSDIRYIKCINEVKNNSIMWIQPVENTTKEIYFIDHIDKDICKDCHWISYNPNNNQFKGLSNNIMIDLNDYITINTVDNDDEEFDELKIKFKVENLLDTFNKPLNVLNQVYYPADIKKIIFIYPKMYKNQVFSWFTDQKFWFRRHNVHYSF